MLKTLLKKQLQELFQSWIIDKKTGKARGRAKLIGFIFLMFLLVIVLGFAFFAMGGGLGAAILGNGHDWMYFSMIGLISIAFGLFGSVFTTYAILYLPKDNEMLLSLPIPEKTLLTARLSSVFMISLLYSAWVWIPGCVAYWVMVPTAGAAKALQLLLTLVITLFVTALSCILGWAVALIASRIKGKSYVSVILTVAFLAIYYAFYFKATSLLTEIAGHLDQIGTVMKNWLHYSVLLGNAATGSGGAVISLILVTAAVAVICYYVMVKTFLKLALSETKETGKKQKGEIYQRRTPQKALLGREFRHFTSISSWMLNGGLGLLIMPVLAVLAVIKLPNLREAMAEIEQAAPGLMSAIPVILTAMMNLLISTNLILPASVSLEGKSIWIVQSLPVDPWEVLRAKESMGVILNTVSAFLSALILCVSLNVSRLSTVLTLPVLFTFILLNSDFGLFMNLKHVNLNWSNETVVIKQGLVPLVCLFGGWIFSILIGGLGVCACGIFGILDGNLTLLLTALLYGGLWLLLHRWLKKKGTRILSEL